MEEVLGCIKERLKREASHDNGGAGVTILSRKVPVKALTMTGGGERERERRVRHEEWQVQEEIRFRIWQQ